MDCERITSANRTRINAFIFKHWYTTTMVIRGKEVDMTNVDGFFLLDHGEIIGLLTYIINENTMEIISLDSLSEGQGIGSTLVERAVKDAVERNCRKVIVVTTNDNINTIRFYQKRGFDMIHFFHNALDISRKLKPEIPLIGANGIPLQHEIEFEKVLNDSYEGAVYGPV